LANRYRKPVSFSANHQCSESILSTITGKRSGRGYDNRLHSFQIVVALGFQWILVGGRRLVELELPFQHGHIGLGRIIAARTAGRDPRP